MFISVIFVFSSLVAGSHGHFGCWNHKCEQVCTAGFLSYTCSCRSGYSVDPHNNKKCIPVPQPTKCQPGFRPSADPRECEDINECDSSNPPCEQVCNNNRGGYTCSCRSGYAVSSSNPSKCTAVGNNCNPGFRPSADPRECEDINECESPNPPCEQVCTNTRGGYSCTCRSGYVVSSSNPSKCTSGGNNCKPGFRPSADPRECEDINECDSPNSPCEQECTNTRGGYTCSCRSGYIVSSSNPSKCTPSGNNCKPGFRPSADPRECEDINECDSPNSPCEQECTNNRGGYTCSCRSGYIVSSSNPSKCTPAGNNCKPGFRPSADPRECEDIDECANNANPPCHQVCANTRGSYVCSCNEGFTLSATDPSKCEAIDYCKTSPCEHICSRTATSFTCSCRSGFKVKDVTKCEDVDECSGSSSPCEQICTNTIGSYTCSCNEGFAVSPTDSSKCESTDNCLNNPCQHVCTNKITGYTCSCGNGYRVSTSDTTKCKDIDECSQSSGSPCAQECTNTEGSFQCSCREGYRISTSDTTKCKDIDECGKGSPCEQTCTNTEGSFMCSCQEGFGVSAADKTKCESTNPCANSPCQHDCATTATGFKCTCKKGYAVSKTDPNKCDDVNECASSPCEFQCTNTKGSYTCSCQEGYAPSQTDKTKCVPTDFCNTKKKCEHICTIIPGDRKCSCREGFVVNNEDNTLCDEIEVCKSRADIIMLFDASNSIPPDQFNKQFDFAKRLSKNFNIGPNDVRFGGLVFSRNTELLFNLKDHNDYAGLEKALTGVKFMNSSTYTHVAFDYVNNNTMFGVEKGGRANAPDIVLLFTDGNPTSKERAFLSADVLKSKGATIIGVGIGKDLEMDVLGQMASKPEDAIAATSYEELEYIEKRLADMLCKVSRSSSG